MNLLTDTIAAVATPPGEGGIAVIRVSGPNAITIADDCFRGRRTLGSVPTHTAHAGEIVSVGGTPVDQVICTVFRAPHSYTGEETVEVSCHGGVLVTQLVLETLLASGARHARPGEFTQRAFLNGRMDLSQAEAVADLIHAHSDMAHRASIQQLRGSLLKSVEALRQQLMDSASLIELELDFVDDGYEFKDKRLLLSQIENTVARLDELASSYRFGRVWREGVSVVITGSPNVGKSSLLNALLNTERAIVTDIPGTTRDFIEESVNLEGIQFRLTDTAGLRTAQDPIETEGVDRAVHLSAEADIVLFVLDQSKAMTQEEARWLRLHARERGPFRKNTIIILNKSDLLPHPDSLPTRLLDLLPRMSVLRVSATSGAGLHDLKATLTDLVKSGTRSADIEKVIVTNSRHYDALTRAKAHLELCRASLNEGRSGEFVAIDLRTALDCLGEITGVVTTEDILNNIFSRFCIGK